MRHGESIANKQGLIVSHPNNAVDGFGLTTNGANQVLEAALNTRLNNNTIIISSDFKRALETAQIMHNVLSLKTPIHYHSLLRERDFGEWELSDHENYHSIWQQDLDNKKGPMPKGIETVENVLKRSNSVIQSLEEKYQNESILIVGHGDVLQILYAHHQNMPPRFHRSLNHINNADIRQLIKVEEKQKLIA